MKWDLQLTEYEMRLDEIRREAREPPWHEQYLPPWQLMAGFWAGVIWVVLLALLAIALLPSMARAYECYCRGYETPGHSHSDHYGQPGNGPGGKSDPGGRK